ncbi:MAG: hypothetical protein L6Q99_16660 [Planctomycetes bacterium]|nr:hypothetical protein [Planctomycetota bacterium]
MTLDGRTAARFSVRGFVDGDEPSLLAAYNRVFAAVDPHFVPRTEREWRWAFRENPSGSRISLAVAEDGRVVAQYAGLGARVLVDGRATCFSQSVDSFVDPDFASGLARATAFVRAGEHYAATFGRPAGPDEAMWGLPVPAAWRIGKEKLGYAVIRSVNFLAAPRERLEGDVADVREFSSVPAEVERLFARVAASRGIIAVRDFAQLDWRYARHPRERYRFAGVVRSGALVAFAIARPATLADARGEALAEWLVPDDEPEAAKALRAWLARTAEREVLAFFADTAPEWLVFQRAGFRVRPSRYVQVGRSYVHGLTIQDLRRRFWWTLGDTDLV